MWSSCCPTCPSVPGRCQCFGTGSPDPRQHPFGSGGSPVRPVIRERPAEGPVMLSRFPVAFRPPAFASRVVLSRQGIGPSSRSAYRTTIGPGPEGFHVPHTRDTTGVVASYAPSPAMLTRPSTPPRPAPAASQRQSLNTAHATHQQGPWITRCQRRFTQFTRPVFPLPVAPGWNRSPWAFLRASDPAVTSDARRGGDRPLSTGPELRCRHQSTLPSSSSLAVCDLMSHV